MLHFDLQLFGGSGASLGKRNRLKQITITKNGVSSTYREYKGSVYRVRQGNVLDGSKKSSKTLAEIKKDAEANGYSVKTYTGAEYKRWEKQYKKNRAETEAQLTRLWNEAGPRPRPGMKGH